MPPRILIACIGNIFLGDDAFGVEVARRLAGRTLPRACGSSISASAASTWRSRCSTTPTTSSSWSTRSRAASRPARSTSSSPSGSRPRNPTLRCHCRSRPMRSTRPGSSAWSPPWAAGPKRLLVVGCEPTPLDPDDDPMVELSAPVRAAVDEAVLMIESLVARIRSGRLPRRGRAESVVGIAPVPRRSPLMKALEFIGGVALGGRVAARPARWGASSPSARSAGI